jgi:hypothetical protein
VTEQPQGTPILILTGPPGIGKSSAAEIIARRSTRGWALSGGRERLHHADVELLGADLEPDAAASAQGPRLLDLRQPEQLAGRTAAPAPRKPSGAATCT